MKLTGKIALVTGAGPNIGQEIARRLAEEGAEVVCNDVDAARAAAAAAYATTSGKARAMAADITDEAAVQRLVDGIVRDLGGLDVLVNNAAITIPKGLLETTLAEWERVLKVILTGTFLVSRAAAGAMVRRGRGGAIVNMASTSGHLGRANAIGYTTAKSGILNLTRSMAMDLVTHGIRVNSVTPTKTGVSVGGLSKAGERFFGEIPMGRLGRPIDQANAVAFLASDDAAFITGVDLRVDGGSLATWGLQPHTLKELGLK